MFPLLLVFGGMALAGGISALGTMGAAWIADKIQSIRTGKKSTAAMDAVKKVGPMVGGIVLGSGAGSALPTMQLRYQDLLSR